MYLDMKLGAHETLKGDRDHHNQHLRPHDETPALGLRSPTCLPRVHDEAGVGEGGSLDQTIAVGSHLAGVADLRLDHHDGDGAVGHVLPVLQDANLVLADLTGDEGDTWGVGGRVRWGRRGLPGRRGASE